MGTKRAFDEELQGFIKHPKHLDYAHKSAFFAGSVEGKHEDPESENDVNALGMFENFETTLPLPLVTEIGPGPGPKFDPNIFAQFLEYNLPRKKLFSYEEAYASSLNGPPRKRVPIGPDHQADIPEFDPEPARYHQDGSWRFRGVFVIPACHSDSEAWEVKTGCTCLDRGSVRCVKQHVKEARLNLRAHLGPVKFGFLGMAEMGEEAVSAQWAQAHERLFHEIVCSNPESRGRNLWEELAIRFPARSKKELVSYYFNVFVLRKRAVENQSRFSEIDSDDDEWHENENENGGLGSEYGFQPCAGKAWGPFYSPTRNIIEEIFGCSKTGNSG